MKCWEFSTKERWMERFDGEKQAFIISLMGLIPHTSPAVLKIVWGSIDAERLVVDYPHAIFPPDS
ncbi:hypothetical protein [Okeania sp. KiyG1]|uniref:hypothetical protein n=1 Tax=Okeania sp. KiyG1 TaxID=2720165 RepID=UPI0019212527|nr:hypothetical protein [Okeania sp. KiyG1]